MNQVILTGRLTKDPEVRYTQNQTPVATFTIAVERDYVKKTVDFIPCKAWDKKADFIEKYFHKGDGIVIEGTLRVENYEDKNGKKQKSTNVWVIKSEFPLGQGKGKPKDEYDTDYADNDDGWQEVPADDGDLPF